MRFNMDAENFDRGNCRGRESPPNCGETRPKAYQEVVGRTSPSFVAGNPTWDMPRKGVEPL